MRSDSGLDRLILELQARHTTTLAIVPAEGAAILRAHRDPANGWQMDLDCWAPLARQLQTLVGEGGDHAGLGPCELHDHTGSQLVHVFIQCHRPELMREVLGAVIDDHGSRRPTERVAALVQIDSHQAPQRIDVRVPPRPRPVQGRTPGYHHLSSAGV